MQQGRQTQLLVQLPDIPPDSVESVDAQYIRIYCKSGSNYVSVSEIAIDYGAAVKYRIQVEVGSGVSIDRPTDEEISGGSYELTITPEAGTQLSTATDNGADILPVLQERAVDPTGQVSSYPTAYATSGTAISGTRYRNCIGKGSGTTDTGNDYANGGQSATSVIIYSFDLSGIPEGAQIDSVEVKVGGHAENASRSTATLQLYSGDTPKGSQSKFTSTSKQVVTLTAGSWTREELQNAKLRFTIGYYGGLVNGVDFVVRYSMPGGADKFYVYTIAKVAEDHVIRLNMGAVPATRIRERVGGHQKKALKIYIKIKGHYTQTDESAITADRLIKL